MCLLFCHDFVVKKVQSESFHIFIRTRGATCVGSVRKIMLLSDVATPRAAQVPEFRPSSSALKREMLHANLIDVARIVLLNEAKLCTCILCGVEISDGEELVCKVHAAQVLSRKRFFP